MSEPHEPQEPPRRAVGVLLPQVFVLTRADGTPLPDGIKWGPDGPRLGVEGVVSTYTVAADLPDLELLAGDVLWFDPDQTPEEDDLIIVHPLEGEAGPHTVHGLMRTVSHQTYSAEIRPAWYEAATFAASRVRFVGVVTQVHRGDPPRAGVRRNPEAARARLHPDD